MRLTLRFKSNFRLKKIVSMDSLLVPKRHLPLKPFVKPLPCVSANTLLINVENSFFTKPFT